MIAALVSRDECASLLARIATMYAAAGAGRAVLALLRRLATPACSWFEGDLVVELFEEERGTSVRVLSDHVGMRERVLPAVVLRASLDDVMQVFAEREELATVFRVERVSTRLLLLLSWDEEEGALSTDFDISETSLAWSPISSEDVDSGWDDAPS